MTGTLFFRLFPGEDPPLMAEASGSVRPATAEEIAHQRVVCSVPGADVLLARLQMPTRSRRQTEKAVPFMMEENIIGALDDQHFALGAQHKDQPLGVAVAARNSMAQWLEKLRLKGLRPLSMVAEPLLLPWEEGQWCVALEPHQALVRHGVQEGFAVDRANLQTFLTLTLRQTDTPPREVRLLDFAGDYANELNLPGIPIQVEHHNSAPLAHLLARGYNRGEAINLLQGAFAQKDTWFSSKMLSYRAPLLLLALWLGLETGVETVRHITLQNRLQSGEEQILQIFRTTFPETRRIVDAEAQMKQEMKLLQGSAVKIGIGFLDLMTASGEVLSRNPNAQLLRLGYQDGELDLHFMVDNLEQLNKIKAELQSKPGLHSEIRSAAAEQGKVQCHIQISWNRDDK